LTVLAAYTHAGIEPEIVADHCDTRHHVRSVANQRGAPDRPGDFSVFDQVGLAG
jgi:hypothetical protein